MLVLPVESDEGRFPPQYSFAQIEPATVVLTAVKEAEDDAALIFRFYEWAGRETNVHLRLPGARHASETNLMEQPTAALPVKDSTVVLHTRPYEIKCVKVEFAPLTRGPSPALRKP